MLNFFIKKYEKFIYSNKLIFVKKKKKNVYNDGMIKKFDFLLCLYQFKTDVIHTSIKNMIEESDFELTILPILKPNLRLDFTEIEYKKTFKMIDNFNIFFLKSFICLCFKMLPAFKRKEALQGEIFRIQIIFCDMVFADTLFLEEFMSKKNSYKNKNSFQIRKENWIRRLKQVFSSNGYIEFSKNHFNTHFRLSAIESLKNNSLIRYNVGPEYRFNLR